MTLSSSALIGALLLTGCGAGNDEPAAEEPGQTTAVAPENESTAEITDDPDDGQASASTESPSGAASGSGENGGREASLAAVETALAQYEGGDVADVDYDDREDKYEVEIIQNDTKHDVTVDGAGENITEEREDGAADQDDLDQLGQATITADEAITRAFDEASSQDGTATLDDVSLDEDNGTLNWEVELDIDDRDVSYYVDANSGSVSSNN